MNSSSQSFTIVGIIKDGTKESAFCTLAAAQELITSSGLIDKTAPVNGAYIQVPSNFTNIEVLETTLRSKVVNRELAAMLSKSNVIALILASGPMQFIELGAIMFLVLSLSVGISFTVTAISVSERRNDLISLRAQGYGKLPLYMMVISENISYGVIAAVIGVPLGFVLTTAYTDFLTAMYYPIPIIIDPVSVSIMVILTSVTIFSLLAGGLVPLYSFLRTDIATTVSERYFG